MRTARLTMLLALGLAAPSLLVGLTSDGPFAGKVLQGGFVLLVGSGLAALWMWRQGAQIDRQHDERERMVIGRSATFTVIVTAVALQAYWVWRFAAEGNSGDDVFWVLALFWTAFTGSLVYNKIRA